MDENNDRLLRMAEATLQRVGLNVQRNRAWLVQALYRVDAEATERAAKVCDGLEAAFIRSDEVQLASVAGACAEDIRSTLARKEADHAEG